MRTCYLHLGMPKTGSTSIQTAFAGYRDRGLVYPRFRTPHHGGTLRARFSDSPANMPKHRVDALGTEEVQKRARAETAAFDRAMKTDKNVVLSCEWIVESLSAGEVAEMFAFFKESFDRLVVIAYVRPLASLVDSQFQQRVRMGKRSFSVPPPPYRGFFAPILANVAREDLQLVRFDRADLAGGDVVVDFARRVGAGEVPKLESEVNESLSAEAVGAIFAFNKYGGYLLPPRERARSLLMMRKTLKDVGEIKFGLGQELIEAHLATHADEVAWMEDQAGFDVKGVIKPAPDPIRSEADLLRMAERYATRRARRMRSRINAGAAL
ncbi:MAG: hypothetical protein AAF676_08100 [Pseudomonadota bacterium]